jgi:hypothetical protein
MMDESVEEEEERPHFLKGVDLNNIMNVISNGNNGSDSKVNIYSLFPSESYPTSTSNSSAKLSKTQFLSSWDITVNFSFTIIGLDGLNTQFSTNLKKLLKKEQSSETDSLSHTNQSPGSPFSSSNTNSVRITSKRGEESNILLYVTAKIFFGGVDLNYNIKHEMVTHLLAYSSNPVWKSTLLSPLSISQIPQEARISFTLFAVKSKEKKDKDAPNRLGGSFSFFSFSSYTYIYI